jgi:hypothetical protein
MPRLEISPPKNITDAGINAGDAAMPVVGQMEASQSQSACNSLSGNGASKPSVRSQTMARQFKHSARRQVPPYMRPPGLVKIQKEPSFGPPLKIAPRPGQSVNPII